MTRARFLGCVCCAASAVLLSYLARSANAASLLGLDLGSTNLYRVSTDDATLSFVGSTGVQLTAFVLNANDGMLYGYTGGASAKLYKVDPNTATATLIAPMIAQYLFLFEGGMAMSPAGVAYGVNFGAKSDNSLFTVDLTNGVVTVGPQLPADKTHDINGMVWRSDGMLVGIDECQQTIVEINPNTGALSVLYDLNAAAGPKPILGAIGDMAAIGNTAYFCAAGPGVNPAGTNDLWKMDLYIGVPELIGAFPNGLSTQGISALAFVPEPATLGLLALASLVLRPRRRR